MGVVIDSSCLIEIERRIAGRRLNVDELPSDPLASAISVAELRVGLELADDAHRKVREAFVEAVVRECTTLPFGVSEAEAYARIVAALRKTGERIGERDLMIAATAVAGGHGVMTRNVGEFARVPGLTLQAPP